VAGLGEAAHRRLYGRLGDKRRMAGWRTVIERHGLELHEPYPADKSERRPGANASDIALTVGAMDLLQEGAVQGFCLVTSDSDLAPLVTRIRRAGLPVYGFGGFRTPRSLVKFCTRFYDLEEPEQDLAPAIKAGRGRRLLPPEEAVAPLLQALERAAGPDGWADLDALKEQLALLPGGFRTGWYGSSKVGRLMQRTGRFEAGTSRDGRPVVRAKPEAGIP
jgi:hypothetical protein